jgi:hypothetical protein
VAFRGDPVARRGAVFAVGVLLALVGGYFVGKAAAPASQPAASAPPHSHDGGGSYAMAVEPTVFAAGVTQPLRFSVRGPAGGIVTRFETRNDKQMHVIVVRADLTGYQHLHPTLGADGVWSVPVVLGAPGTCSATSPRSAPTAAGSTRR